MYTNNLHCAFIRENKLLRISHIYTWNGSTKYGVWAVLSYRVPHISMNLISPSYYINSVGNKLN